MRGYIETPMEFVVPAAVEYNGEVIVNPSEEILAELGYLELVESEKPNDGNSYAACYEEKDGKVYQSWHIAAPTDAERIAELEEALEMLLSGVTE